MKIPGQKDIDLFIQMAKEALKNLNFQEKKAIVGNIIEKVVATQTKLQVYGFIPVTNINVFTIHRNRRSPKRRKIDPL
jgi:hypothetical protein